MGVYECELRAICVLRAPEATMRTIKNECLLRRLALLVTSLSESECVGLDDLKLGSLRMLPGRCSNRAAASCMEDTLAGCQAGPPGVSRRF